jgi:endogenous inhibitor of DNA gyrase (YacG/DUF329 family)
MKRCALCGGKFGLIRQRWHSRQFCSAKCREKFLNQVANDRDKVRLRTPYESNDPAYSGIENVPGSERWRPELSVASSWSRLSSGSPPHLALPTKRK